MKLSDPMSSEKRWDDCPRCGSKMAQATVDIGVGKIPCGPMGCDICYWVVGLSDEEQAPDARRNDEREAD